MKARWNVEHRHGRFPNALARLLFLIRPLRVIDTFSGLHDILHVIPGSLRSMRDLLCLILFGLVIIAIFCASLFNGGTMHGRCVVTAANTQAEQWVRLTTRFADDLGRASPVKTSEGELGFG
jgi:hypothetical protein